MSGASISSDLNAYADLHIVLAEGTYNTINGELYASHYETSSGILRDYALTISGAGTLHVTEAVLGKSITLNGPQIQNPGYYIGGVHYEGIGNFQTIFNSNGAMVENGVTFGPVYTVTYAANGGSGEMAAVNVAAGGEFTLPQCTILPPSGKHFGGWLVNGDTEAKQPGETITISANTTITAQWAEGALNYNITINDIQNGTVTASPETAEAGATVTLTVTPHKDETSEYYLDTLTVQDANGQNVAAVRQADGTYTFVMPAGGATVNATFTAVTLWVGDIPVTKDNADNVTGDNTVRYDIGENELYLTNAAIVGGIRSTDRLDIYLTGGNTVRNDSGDGITITGDNNSVNVRRNSGSLTVTASDTGIVSSSSVYVRDGADLTVAGGVGVQCDTLHVRSGNVQVTGSGVAVGGKVNLGSTSDEDFPHVILSGSISGAITAAEEGNYRTDPNGAWTEVARSGAIPHNGLTYLEYQAGGTVATVTVNGETSNYITLQDALDAAAQSPGSTVTLKAASYDSGLTANGTFTIDINGYHISHLSVAGGNVTLTNSATSENVRRVYARGGTLTLSGAYVVDLYLYGGQIVVCESQLSETSGFVKAGSPGKFATGAFGELTQEQRATCTNMFLCYYIELDSDFPTTTFKTEYRENEKAWYLVDAIASHASITGDSFTYNGQPQTPALSTSLTQGTDYTVSYAKVTDANQSEPLAEAPTDAGSYTMTVTGTGNYYGALTQDFTIAPKEVTNPVIEGIVAQYLHTGEEIKPVPTAVKDGNMLIAASEYTVTYENNVNAGTATLKIVDAANGNYTVSGSTTFEIVVHTHVWSYNAEGNTITATCSGNIGTCPNKTQTIQVVAPTGELVYDGTAKAATTEGSIEDVTAPTITYEGDCKSVGTHYATIKLGDAEAKVSFTITAAAPTVAWETTTESMNYTGSDAVIPAPKVTLVNGETYNGEISYSYTGPSSGDGRPVNAGTYEITASIAAQGNYTEATSTNKLMLTINKVTASVTKAPEAIVGLKFQEESGKEVQQNLITAGEAAGGTMVYRVDDGEWSETIPTAGQVRDYTVSYKVLGDSNHNDSAEGSVSVSIGQAAAPTVTIPEQEHFYTIPTTGNRIDIKSLLPNFCAIINEQSGVTGTTGDFITNAVLNNGILTYDTAAASAPATGTITVKIVMRNYEYVTVTVNVELVDKQAATITLPTASNGTYNGNAQTGYTGSPSAEGYNGDFIITYEGRNGTTYGPSAEAPVNAGDYTVTFSIPDDDLYLTGSASVDFTIAKAAVTITADSKVIYIGEEVPLLTCTVTGLVTGDMLDPQPNLTTKADKTKAGSYTITPAGADAGANYAITYVNGTLTIMDQNTEVETKVETAALTTVPDGLQNTQYDTVEEIKEELTSRIVASSTGFARENMGHYDVTLQFSLDGGNSWILATEENFPTEGITVTLPYPNGTNAAGYDFVVSHMFTVTSRRLGTTAGGVELPRVTETASGIRVTLNGLSPVTVAWKATEFDVDIAGTTNGTVTTNVSKATSGTEVTVTVTPKSGYKMATLTVKDASGKSYAVSTDNNGKYYFTMPAADVTVTATFSKISSSTADPTNPKTGDTFNIGIWCGVMLMSSLSLAAILFEDKRRRSTK